MPYASAYYTKNREKILRLHHTCYQGSLERRRAVRAGNQRFVSRIRAEIFEAYGTCCACCGLTDKVFLALDHINGNGSQERRNLKKSAGTQFYRWLKTRNFPPGYQILCHNCNYAKSHGGCPHKTGPDG